MIITAENPQFEYKTFEHHGREYTVPVLENTEALKFWYRNSTFDGPDYPGLLAMFPWGPCGRAMWGRVYGGTRMGYSDIVSVYCAYAKDWDLWDLVQTTEKSQMADKFHLKMSTVRNRYCIDHRKLHHTKDVHTPPGALFVHGPEVIKRWCIDSLTECFTK